MGHSACFQKQIEQSPRIVIGLALHTSCTAQCAVQFKNLFRSRTRVQRVNILCDDALQWAELLLTVPMQRVRDWVTHEWPWMRLRVTRHKIVRDGRETCNTRYFQRVNIVPQAGIGRTKIGNAGARTDAGTSQNHSMA